MGAGPLPVLIPLLSILGLNLSLDTVLLVQFFIFFLNGSSFFLISLVGTVWKPPCDEEEILESFPAKIQGFNRRFWQHSIDHRSSCFSLSFS